MKIALWIVVGLLAALWSGSAWLLHGLSDWAASGLSQGDAGALGRAAAAWQPPGWLVLWIDPALIKALQAGLLWALDATQQGLPWLGSALAWLKPLIWTLWALGLGLLLALAGLGHWLLGRLLTANATSPGAA